MEFVVAWVKNDLEALEATSGGGEYTVAVYPHHTGSQHLHYVVCANYDVLRKAMQALRHGCL